MASRNERELYQYVGTSNIPGEERSTQPAAMWEKEVA